MNIFYLHEDAITAAQYHCDRHVVKMILESCQLLSTAHRVLDGTEMIKLSATGRKKKAYVLPDKREGILYSATHINHPSAIWARHVSGNYEWLFDLAFWLCKEYTFRYGKIHKCEYSLLLDHLSNCPINMAEGPKTPILLAMPDECKEVDPVSAYRRYYLEKRQSIATWNKTRKQPEWWSACQYSFS